MPLQIRTSLIFVSNNILAHPNCFSLCLEFFLVQNSTRHYWQGLTEGQMGFLSSKDDKVTLPEKFTQNLTATCHCQCYLGHQPRQDALPSICSRQSDFCNFTIFRLNQDTASLAKTHPWDSVLQQRHQQWCIFFFFLRGAMVHFDQHPTIPIFFSFPYGVLCDAKSISNRTAGLNDMSSSISQFAGRMSREQQMSDKKQPLGNWILQSLIRFLVQLDATTPLRNGA